jgi:hypothetical protein
MSITNDVSWTAFKNREYLMKPQISGQCCEVLLIVLMLHTHEETEEVSHCTAGC